MGSFHYSSPYIAARSSGRASDACTGLMFGNSAYVFMASLPTYAYTASISATRIAVMWKASSCTLCPHPMTHVDATFPDRKQANDFRSVRCRIQSIPRVAKPKGGRYLYVMFTWDTFPSPSV
jgi:hypothetical protein